MWIHVGEQRAQGTVEYAITVAALLSLIVGVAAVWRSGRDGVLAGLVERAASHGLGGLGPLDISLF